MSITTTSTTPECCPFCGADLLDKHKGLSIAEYKCQTVTFRPLLEGSDNREEQSEACADAERERLTRERDGARAERDQALMLLGVYKTRSGDLLARVKRLEEAGDAIVDHNIGCGCGQDGPCRACRMACEAWTQAKEAKP